VAFAEHRYHRTASPHGLLGRQRELARLAHVLFDLRAGRSRSLVLQGESGIGKTALLDDVAGLAGDMTVVRTSGVQAEGELAHGALQALWSQLPADGLVHLPEPQRTALTVTFGLERGPAPNVFLLGLAMLNRLADVAERRPLLVLVDDAQWMDDASARTLGFLARRLQAEGIGLVFAVRTEIEPLADLPVLTVRGLDAADSRALYSSVARGPVSEAILERFIAEAAGNPLALLESSPELPHGGLDRVVGRREPDGRGLRLEEAFKRRTEGLSADAGLLLLTAAAEPLGDAMLLWRAADALGLAPDAAHELHRQRLLRIDARVLFRHPLVRSAVYRFAGPDARREVHRALAEVTDAALDPERHAWHRALAAAAPDEAIAVELERAAERAAGHGGYAAAAALLERALILTADERRKGVRALAAAQAMLAAADHRGAGDLVSVARRSRLDERATVQCEVIAARLAFALDRGHEASMLLRAARKQEGLDPVGARDTYFDAMLAALRAGGGVPGTGPRHLAEAARGAVDAAAADGPSLLAQGISTLVDAGHEAAAPVLRGAVAAVLENDLVLPGDLRWVAVATRAAVITWDADAWDELTRLQVHHVRALGAFDLLPQALSDRVGPPLLLGEVTAAGSVVHELEVVCEAMGTPVPASAAASLAVYGPPDGAMAFIDAEIEDATARRDGGAVTQLWASKAILSNALGRYHDAWVAAAAAYRDPLIWAPLVLGELIEAAERSGRREEAGPALEDLSERARAAPTAWALGIETRSRALVSDAREAEPLYRSSIEHLQRARAGVHVARSQLIYGEWLRRQGRRVDARRQLRAASDAFHALGAVAFAQRARRELAATGETARRRDSAACDDQALTDRERQIARLAAAGLSNRDIGQQLFISHRTVGYHLAKVFAKLGVSSRTLISEDMLGDDEAQDRSP
jgi:DNA-binding CsgD family transcriptional regulator